MMKKMLLKFVLVLVLITNHYTVTDGDTLQSIAEKFCQSDNKIQVAEFREGIRELNYDIIGEGDVEKGMVILVNQFKEANK
jgi:LysM repeat protein